MDHYVQSFAVLIYFLPYLGWVDINELSKIMAKRLIKKHLERFSLEWRLLKEPVENAGQT